MNGDAELLYGLNVVRLSRAGQKIRSVLNQIRSVGFADPTPFKIGKVEKRMLDYSVKNGVTLAGNDVYMSSRSIGHALRPSKEKKGISVSDPIYYPSKLFIEDQPQENEES